MSVAIWRSGELLLVSRGESFCLVEPTGAITKRFESSEWSIDDDLGRSYYAVVGEQLRQFTTVEGWGGRTRNEDELVIDRLEAATDPETRHFVETVLGDDLVVREDRREHAERAAEVRIDAIAGSRDDFALGVDFERARHALCHRIRAYDDTLSASLLRTLIDLARAGVRSTALAAFVEGCLYACFDRPGEVVVSGSTDASETVGDLAGRLRDHATELDGHARSQEWADANANARAYHQAAAAIRRAAASLA